MEKKLEFTTLEKEQIIDIAKRLKDTIGKTLYLDDETKIMSLMKATLDEGKLHRDVFGLNPLLFGFQTAELAVNEIGLKRDAVIATLLYGMVINGHLSIEQTGAMFGESVRLIIHGLVRIHELYSKNPVIESENFRNLLLSFAEECRSYRNAVEAIARQAKCLPGDGFDGISIAPTLLGNDAAQKHRDYLYWEFHETDQIGVRMGNWKLVVEKGQPHLFNLVTDLHEDHDVASIHPDILSKMLEVIKKEHTPSADFVVTLPSY
jgi:hypothetical protein